MVDRDRAHCTGLHFDYQEETELGGMAFAVCKLSFTRFLLLLSIGLVGGMQGCQLSLIESETHSFWSFLTLKTLFHLHAFLLISLILTDKLYHWPMGVSLSTCFQCWQPCNWMGCRVGSWSIPFAFELTAGCSLSTLQD